MLVPIFYLIFGAVITDGTDTDMAYAGGLMAVTMLLVGGCTPAMMLGVDAHAIRTPRTRRTPCRYAADRPRSCR